HSQLLELLFYSITHPSDGHHYLYVIGFVPKSITQTRSARGSFRKSCAQHALRRPNFNVVSRTRKAGVNQFPGQDRRIVTGQNQQHGTELRTLAFVNSHGKYGLVRWQSRWWKFAYRAIGARKENTHFTVGFGIGKNYADVSVEELQVVIVSRDHYRAAAIPLPFPLQESGFRKTLLSKPVQFAHSVRAVSQRMFEKSWQIKTHGTRTRVRPSCLEAGMGNIVGEIRQNRDFSNTL